jgi:hypothetical protein
MPTFAEWFRETLGRPCPLPAELQPAQQRDATVWCSESLVSRELELPVGQSFIDGLDYVLAGHWGHGVNSYAVYYIGVWGTHRVFFRLAYGGVYSDPEGDAAFAVDFLTAYSRFRERQGSRLSGLTIIHEMGTSVADLAGVGQVWDKQMSGGPEAFFSLLEKSS